MCLASYGKASISIKYITDVTPYDGMKAIHDTYKSIWIEEDNGCYTRHQKPSYAHENLIPKIAFEVPKLKSIAALIGKKPQGEDFYRYYSEVIAKYLTKGSMGKWEGEFDRVYKQINENIKLPRPLTGLDISGEPGFFSKDALSKNFANLCVTAFADSVSPSINLLGIKSFKYDFNSDSLTDKYPANTLDIVFARYCIGFCLDIDHLFKEIALILKPNGYFYTSFSPASRAVCARWMFDDYTYLKQWTSSFVEHSAEEAGLNIIKTFNEGSYKWDKDLNRAQKVLSRPYTKNLFKNCSNNELYQHNIGILFQK